MEKAKTHEREVVGVTNDKLTTTYSSMQRIKQSLPLLAISTMILLASVEHGLFGQEPGEAKTSTFMRMKLEPTKGVLEGIALADYAMITKNAGLIRNMLLDEGWMVKQTEDYRRQSEEFRKVVEQLRDAAKNKNLDGATLAYLQLTIRCVQCHQSLRK